MSSSYFIPILAAAATTFPVPPSPPVISGISSGTPSTTGATITWSTDTLADSLVDYGLTTSYGSTTGVYNTSPKVLSHTATLSGLTLGTGYHYRITSRDAFGQATLSSDQTFTTAGAPVISSIDATPIGDTTATIIWTTDIASDSQVVYGLTSSYDHSTTLDPTAVTSHSVDLTGLDASTGYHYAVKSGVTTSSDQTFTTTSGSFDPGTLAELQAWYKTPFGSHSDGDALTTWTDSSSHTNDITFSGGTAATDSVYKTAIQNGLDIVRTANSVRLGTTGSAIDLSAGFSLYFVGAPAFGTIGHGILDNATGFVNWFWDGTNTDSLYDLSAAHVAVGPATSSVAWHVHSASGTTTTMIVGTDGTDGSTLTDTSVGPWPNTVLRVPAVSGRPTVWWGDIGEILICAPKLSAGNHTAMITYLKTRWGIS